VQVYGVRMGMEHGNATPQDLMAMQSGLQGSPHGLSGRGADSATMHWLKLQPRHLRGASADATVRAYAHGLVQLVHSLGLGAVAAGVEDSRELPALWALGIDAATGPAVQLKSTAAGDAPLAETGTADRAETAAV
jgi:EAL domain